MVAVRNDLEDQLFGVFSGCAELLRPGTGGRLGTRVHFWPFDGRDIPTCRSAIAEVYPALWYRTFPTEDRNSHQHDAYSVARWMQPGRRSGATQRPAVGQLAT